MIRFIFVALFLFLYLILGIPVYLILRLICKINKKAGDYASLRLVQWAFRVILKISGTEITVIGEENVPDEAVLFVGNHRSYFDILLLFSIARAFFIRTFLTSSPNVTPDFSLMYLDRYGLER